MYLSYDTFGIILKSCDYFPAQYSSRGLYNVGGVFIWYYELNLYI
jgi:hypothetical protein